MILDIGLASTRFILTSVILAILFFSEMPPLAAQTSLHTDRSGYTTGTIDSKSVNIYRDRYGNTTGSIGSNHVSTYSDGYGGTTGMIGNKPITTYGDGYATQRVRLAKIGSILTQIVPDRPQAQSVGGGCFAIPTALVTPRATRGTLGQGARSRCRRWTAGPDVGGRCSSRFSAGRRRHGVGSPLLGSVDFLNARPAETFRDKERRKGPFGVRGQKKSPD
jgi:hypothetical protein